jgi:peptidyl-prolyl cis-trans isomerase D
MPFEVFRRHQRKLLATFAILAMFGFVVSDSLPKLLSPNMSGRDQPVATLYGKTVYHSAINEMAMQRSNANQFVGRLSPYIGPTPFGTLRTRDLVDALILQHEADRLGIPAGPDLGREFLKNITQGQMTRDTFEVLLAGFNNQVSGEQILADIANQVRLANVRALLGQPMVTPYDIFRAYRDQNERVSAKAIEVPVDKFLAQVPEPTAQDIQAEYEAYKEVLPDPARPTPGFKVPRQVQVEILSIDGNALARGIRDRLSEAELRTAYENRKAEFEEKSQPERGDLPTDLFADQPELTPPVIRPFAEVRSILASTLAEEKVQAQIVETFGKIKDDVLIPFADAYQTAFGEIDEARKQGTKSTVVLPKATDLKELAQREGLTYDLSPMLSREEAERYSQISGAEVGLSRLNDSPKFADEFFDTKTGLYEPVELTDLLGTRYLARKVQDVAPHVPPLDQVRSSVALAWKTEKARPLAEQAAERLATDLKKQGGVLKDATVQGYRVMTIPPIARQQASFLPGRFDPQPPQETPVPEVPHAGEAFRSAYFALQPGTVAVAPNQPKTTYFVLAADHREPATFAALYAPNGDEFRYKMMAREQAGRLLVDHWMDWLRQQAGLDPGWVPADEAKSESNSRRS